MDAQRGPHAPGRGPFVGGAVVLGVLLVVLVALAVSTASAGLGVAALLVAALGLSGAAVHLARATPPPVVAEPAAPVGTTPPARDVDDLQGFFDSPPGSVPADPAAPPAPEVSPPAPVADPPPLVQARDVHRRVAALATAAVGLVVVAGVVAVATDGGGRGAGGHEGRDRPQTTVAAPSTTAPATSAAPLTAAAAGGLAATAVTPGDDGITARLAFQGIVLEPRAVGATFSYPTLDLSSDGTTAVAHLELPTWNCLSGTAPPEPTAADCTPSLTEFADLGTPGLGLREVDGEFELTGTFATYTRPNGSAPVYTGRSYTITVQAGPDGRAQDGRIPAAGELELGGAIVATTADRDANTVQLGD